MPIQLFEKGKELKQNQLFITHKDSVEGQEKTILQPLPTKFYGTSKSDDIGTIIYLLRNDGHSYPDEVIAGICHVLNEDYLHIQKPEEKVSQ